MNRTEQYMVGDHVYVSSGSLSGLHDHGIRYHKFL